ncbi:hypothetical protein P280DRAFT_121062 [Massarina eburnea CBS 473.64]|uniref:Uncharacterized protein n=1 Tax=Massarina eburnea CBS 473.64 TaxID=1395130 RepID=A0A6A6SGA5_9PLEO|nr:hypothetical protein P280DRAFT_121062 [Massarina eburnea CBS 473.64]
MAQQLGDDSPRTLNARPPDEAHCPLSSAAPAHSHPLTDCGSGASRGRSFSTRDVLARNVRLHSASLLAAGRRSSRCANANRFHSSHCTMTSSNSLSTAQLIRENFRTRRRLLLHHHSSHTPIFLPAFHPMRTPAQDEAGARYFGSGWVLGRHANDGKDLHQAFAQSVPSLGRITDRVGALLFHARFLQPS